MNKNAIKKFAIERYYFIRGWNDNKCLRFIKRIHIGFFEL